MQVSSPTGRPSLTAQQRADAERFALGFERQPAAHSVDELTEEDCLAIDRAYAADKAGGALDRAREKRAGEAELQWFRATGQL